MRSLILILGGLSLGLSTLPASGQEPATQEAAAKKPARGPLRVERGTGELALVVPRAEELRFKSESGSGTAVFRSRVANSPSALPVDPPSGPAEDVRDEHEIGILRIDVEADGFFYSIDAMLETRLLSQEWPRLINRYVRVGKKSRRRVIRLGRRDGEPSAGYRRDTADGAPAGTRIWREERFREVPDTVLDTVSALQLARSMVVEGLPSAQFPMIDREQLWRMRARRGKERRIKTPAGTFDAVEVILDPEPWPGEERDKDGDRVVFKGLFGMEGAIHVWMHRDTGTPVRIEGEVPAGLMDIDLVLELDSYKGTPAGFRTAEERTE